MSPSSSSALNAANRRCQIGFIVCCVIAFHPPMPLSAAQQTESPATSQPVVLVTVNGTAITADHVERDITRTLQGINLTPAQRREAREATLDKLINQRIAYDFLNQHQIAAGDDEVQLQIDELETELETVEKTIDDYLGQTNQTLDELRFQTAWQISWKRYLQRKLTDEFLESHFNKNKRQLDGTELLVAHLLLKSHPDSTPEQLEELTQTAKTIGKQITQTSMTWEEAVAQYSQAPTRDSGGLIGWIKVDGPMPQSFTRTAFKLSAGQISEPVATKFGVHIIKCLEVKEGKLGWRDMIDEVRKSASRAYFDAIVKQHRPEVSIKK